MALEDRKKHLDAADSNKRTAFLKGRDTYSGYRELRRKEIEGVDYRIILNQGVSGITVMAPHGGRIEPGTSEIARAIASDEHTFYGFEGMKPAGNFKLHITSAHFDEPFCIDAVKRSKAVLIIHGCKGNEEKVYIGGLDPRFRTILQEHLRRAGFLVGMRPGLEGRSTKNLCNGCPGGMGVQMEITSGLRRLMLGDLTQVEKTTTHLFTTFVRTVQQAISYIAENLLPETTCESD